MEIQKAIKSVMQMSLDEASKNDLTRQFSTLTINKIIQGDYLKTGALIRRYGVDKVEIVLQALTLELSSSFDADLDAEDIAVEITSTYKNLCLEDVYLCFTQIKRSKHYGKLTENKILTALDEYFNTKIKATDDLNYNKHLANKHNFGERTSEQKDKKQHEVTIAHLMGKII